MVESKSSDFQAIVRDVYHDATGYRYAMLTPQS